MRLKVILTFASACALGGALAGIAALQADATPDPAREPDVAVAVPDLSRREVHRRIDRYRRETWRWQQTMGKSLTRRLASAPRHPLQRIAAWKRLALRMRRAAQNPPHRRAWLCIHRYEAAWNDAAPPYYGGLQMDLGFQRAYGAHLVTRKGTADRWTPLEQMWVAERAHRIGRGFWPWPNSARSCGLL
jgi:hypothetical protein